MCYCVQGKHRTTMELPPVEPVFVKARDIINFKAIKEINTYEAVTEKINPGYVFGIQRIGMLWRMYPSNQGSRLKLLTEHIVIGEQTIECFSNNPLRVGLKEGEDDNDVLKIVIKGIPLSKGNDQIKEYLRQQNIKLRRPVQNGKLRDKNNICLKCTVETELCIQKTSQHHYQGEQKWVIVWL